MTRASLHERRIHHQPLATDDIGVLLQHDQRPVLVHVTGIGDQ